MAFMSNFTSERIKILLPDLSAGSTDSNDSGICLEDSEPVSPYWMPYGDTIPSSTTLDHLFGDRAEWSSKANPCQYLTSSTIETMVDGALDNRDLVDSMSSSPENADSDNSPSAESSQNSSIDYPDGDIQEELIAPMLDPVKQELVARLMADFYTMFNSDLPPRTEAEIQTVQALLLLHECGGSSTPTASNLLNGANNDKETSTPLSGSFPSEKKRSLPPDDDDDNDAKRRKKTHSQVAVECNSMKYACHFHQDDPQQFSCNNRTGTKYRACAGPGWESVHRVKEHLYRCHKAPIQCRRCQGVFKSVSDLGAHEREDVRCEVLPPHPTEGIDEDKMQKLKSRRRKPGTQAEDERWRDVFRILFPGKPVPSPFYEYSNSQTDERVPSPSSQIFSEFEEYSRRQLPLIVESRLVARVSSELQPLEESLRSELVDIIRDAQENMYRAFWVTRHNAIPTVDMPSDVDAQRSSGISPLEPQISTPASASQDLASFFQQPPESEMHTSMPSISSLLNPTLYPSSDSGFASQSTPVRDSAQSNTGLDHVLGHLQNELDMPSEAPEPHYDFNMPTERLNLRNEDFDFETFMSSNFDATDFGWPDMADQSSLSMPVIPEYLPDNRHAM